MLCDTTQIAKGYLKDTLSHKNKCKYTNTFTHRYVPKEPFLASLVLGSTEPWQRVRVML